MTSDTPDSAPPVSGPAVSESAALPAKSRGGYAFRKNRAPLPRDKAQRQGEISRLAFLGMGGRDGAIAFLNTEDAELGGRPLAVATASAEGFARVAAAIRARASTDI